MPTPHHLVLVARHYKSMVYAVDLLHLYVALSVCLSQVSVLSKTAKHRIMHTYYSPGSGRDSSFLVLKISIMDIMVQRWYSDMFFVLCRFQIYFYLCIVCMADYWKSQPRHFCEFCKCWTADNKAVIYFLF